MAQDLKVWETVRESPRKFACAVGAAIVNDDNLNRFHADSPTLYRFCQVIANPR
jgi:hypothetical protein